VGYVLLPATRADADKPEEWLWSSFRHYLYGEEEIVEIESEWTARRRICDASPGWVTRSPLFKRLNLARAQSRRAPSRSLSIWLSLPRAYTRGYFLSALRALHSRRFHK
jgi:hypothetical protein